MKQTRIWMVPLCFVLAILPWRPAYSLELDQKTANHGYPRIANYYLFSPISDSAARQLAKWDVLILSPQTQENSRAQLKLIRELNPDAVFLVYIPSEEFPIGDYQSWESNPNGFWHRLYRGIGDKMWILDASGKKVAFWKSNWMLDPESGWADYLSQFVAQNFFSAGDDLWDGVFFDNVWTDISWINNGNLDLNRDGQKDRSAEISSRWQKGMERLFTLTRQRINREIIIVGNGDRGYYNYLNGHYFESFSQDINTRWSTKMELYRASARQPLNSRVAIIGNNTLNTGAYQDYRNVRFGLASSLLENGYYGFDYGDQGHENIWLYDEYDVNLGNPVGEARSAAGFSDYQPDTWQREFEHGISIANSAAEKKTVELGGDYEKIHGTQDATVNDGAIVSEVNVDANDGLILLKTFAAVDDVIFENGAFLRFFRGDGSRARNGFFVFEESQPGGVQVAKIDLNKNGRRELITVDGPLVSVWRDDGLLYQKTYPYGADYAGKLRIAVGDLDGDGYKEIFVAPADGSAAPIKVYSRDGEQLKSDWYPFGLKYKGGYSIDVGYFADGSGANNILIGTGVGTFPIAHIFNSQYRLLRSWWPFELGFRGGVNVAAGDINGDGIDEVIVGPGRGKAPVIRIFDSYGKKIAEEFSAYSSLAKPGIKVMAADVDFDGKDDIVGMSEGL